MIATHPDFTDFGLEMRTVHSILHQLQPES